MIVLGIDTATGVSSVALGSSAGPLGSRTLATGRNHVEFLMPAIRSLAGEAAVPLSRIGGIAVDVGPGLFTSMRVGIATAKTLAQMLVVPLVGIASLDVLAFAVRHAGRPICACIDAKRGEVFAALYRGVPGGVLRETEPAVWKPEALAAEMTARGGGALLVGDGAVSYRAAFASVDGVRTSAPAHPDAAGLVELAIPLLGREEHVTPARLEPLYVRRSDAEIRWEERGVVIERPSRVQVPKRARGKTG